MNTCFSIAVLSTALIGGLTATSSPADAYAGWSCKPLVLTTAYGLSSLKPLVKAEGQAKWVQYIQAHHGSAYLHPRQVKHDCPCCDRVPQK
jgi:hypothetical protein